MQIHQRITGGVIMLRVPRTDHDLAELFRLINETGIPLRERKRPQESFCRINGKAIKVFSVQHFVAALGIRHLRGVQKLYQAKLLPPPLLDRFVERKGSHTWRWYTIEELRETRACAALHRKKNYINWKFFSPDYCKRIDNLENLFRRGDLPLLNDPEAVAYYQKQEGKP